MSSFAGWIGNIKIESLTLRKQLFGWYSKIYGCNLEEASKPLEDYESFSEFFARNLKWNARKIERVNGLVSACDGTLLHCGQLTVGGEGKGKGEGIYPEQVKGSLYPLKDLIGDEAVEKISKKSTDSDKSLSLYYCTIYLAPGDYHRFHAPAKMKIESIKKFSGEVLSVAPCMIKLVPKLFCMNERIAINGRWKHGFISYVPVGAANVGSIVIDPEIETKKFIEAGKEIGHFELGSTVVLIFEAPKNSKWQFSPGDRVQLGMPLIEVPKSSWFF
jgi:phosphatidylserine decarboxylase